jgi:hypothetical protein
MSVSPAPATAEPLAVAALPVSPVALVETRVDFAETSADLLPVRVLPTAVFICPIGFVLPVLAPVAPRDEDREDDAEASASPASESVVVEESVATGVTGATALARAVCASGVGVWTVAAVALEGTGFDVEEGDFVLLSFSSARSVDALAFVVPVVVVLPVPVRLRVLLSPVETLVADDAPAFATEAVPGSWAAFSSVSILPSVSRFVLCVDCVLVADESGDEVFAEGTVVEAEVFAVV